MRLKAKERPLCATYTRTRASDEDEESNLRMEGRRRRSSNLEDFFYKGSANKHQQFNAYLEMVLAIYFWSAAWGEETFEEWAVAKAECITSNLWLIKPGVRRGSHRTSRSHESDWKKCYGLCSIISWKRDEHTLPAWTPLVLLARCAWFCACTTRKEEHSFVHLWAKYCWNLGNIDCQARKVFQKHFPRIRLSLRSSGAAP